jgi:predicted adenylyl cyclase CyaB
MVWLEVETKIPIPNKNVAEIRKKIKRIARFQKKESRGDDYFAIRTKGYPKKAFRIRKKPDKFEVNFKKKQKKLYSKGIVVKQEFEFVLKEKEHVNDLLALFKDLGFREWMKKRKSSETYLHKKDKRIVIELNKVAHLGYFIEIEYLCQPSEIKKARKKIYQALKDIGINLDQINNTGYTRQLWDKGIKDKRYFID